MGLLSNEELVDGFKIIHQIQRVEDEHQKETGGAEQLK
jgi:hypothetical protein